MISPLRLSITIPLAFSAAIAAAAPAGPARGAAAEPAGRTVSVPGQGEARAAPDEVTFTLSVVREGAEAKHARMEVAAATRAILAALKQRGVAEADVQTAATSLVPNDRFDGGRRTISGYRTSTTLAVKLRDLAAYDGMLAAAMQAGANEFHGARFGSSRQADLEAKARTDAVADAKARAEALAAAAGARVGRIVSLAESSAEIPPMPMVGMRAMGAMRPEESGPTLAGGEITVRVTIQAAWTLE
jgi:hypothetical protein